MLLRFNRFFYLAAVAFLALIAGLLYQYWVADDGYKLNLEIQQRVEQRKAEYRLVSARNQRLRLEIEAIKSSKNAIEEMARIKFGLIKDGEVFYRFDAQFLDTERRSLKR